MVNVGGYQKRTDTRIRAIFCGTVVSGFIFCALCYSYVNPRTTDEIEGAVVEYKSKSDGTSSQRKYVLERNPLKILEENLYAVKSAFETAQRKLDDTTKDNQSKVDLETPESVCKEDLFLLILVHSQWNNFAKREAIRLSWGNQSNVFNDGLQEKRSWKTVFLFGKTTAKAEELLQREQSVYGDLIVGEFIDHYRNLTLKTLLGLRWASRQCQAAYVMKTDDDCFVNILPLIKHLDSIPANQSDQLYFGRKHWNNQPVRVNTSKYYVSYEEYDKNTYPKYHVGGGYIFSGKLLLSLLEVASKTKVFPMEDTYFGVLMASLGVSLTNDKRVMSFDYCGCHSASTACDRFYKDASICDISRQFVIHNVNGWDQIRMYASILILTHVPTICEHEVKRRNWRPACP